MRNKSFVETELFRKSNILLLDKNKNHLEDVKERVSLLANTEIDNSGFVRGVIEYFYENQEELKKLAGYVKEYKGYNILSKFQEMVEANAPFSQIEEEIGISVDIVEAVMERAKKKRNEE